MLNLWLLIYKYINIIQGKYFDNIIFKKRLLSEETDCCFLVSSKLLATVFKGVPKAPFSIATTPRCRGERLSFPWIAPLYPSYGLKYHFLCLWYDWTWYWTPVSQAIGEHSAHLFSLLSSSCNYIYIYILTGYWPAIHKLSIVWKSDLSDEIKQNFFQAVIVSLQLYRCTTWTLTKCQEKKLDGNYTRM